MFDKPITFKEADQALAKRKDKTTYMKSREIALAWNADARSRAFFSARVANATILSEIHRRVESVVAGKGTDAQARALLQRYFIGEGADALAELGFAPQRDAKGVAQLASTARLKLIIDTNVTMAQEVGQYKQWSDQRDIYKYGIWKCGYSEEHRPEHLARDGKAYAFDHPIWTQSPPGGEFNCHCYRMLVREEDVFERGITPERPDIPFEPSSLGFNPARGIRKPPEFGKRVRKEYKDKAKEQMAQFKPEEDVDRFDGDGVALVSIDSPARIKDGMQGSLDAISEITGAKTPPFDSVHRTMTEREIAKYTYEDGTVSLGIHYVSKNRGMDGKKQHEIAIRPDCPHPAFTDMHEMVHAYIDEGIIREKEVEKIYQLVQRTGIYEICKKKIGEAYGDKQKNEWVTRAVTWNWVSRTANPVVKKEKLAILENKDYLNYTVWDGFGFSEKVRMNDIELGNAIMKMTPKTFFGKLRRKLGFSDTRVVESRDEDILIWGITRKELQAHCDEKGITIEDFFANMEKNYKEWVAAPPEKRTIAIL